VRLRAIDWTAQLAGFFPWLRPDGDDILQFAEKVAEELGPNDGHVPPERIEEGVALLPSEERRRLVASFADRHPDQWTAVRSDSGEGPALERSLVAGAVRATILERRLPPVLRLDHLERGIAPVRSPQDALAVTLPPEAVWSAIDEQAAEKAAADSEMDRDWFGAITSVAVARMHEGHAARVQTLAAALRRRLPATGFPTASAVLDDAYARAESDVDFAQTVVIALLPVYVAQNVSYITSSN
jgi:hypothetical protein